MRAAMHRMSSPMRSVTVYVRDIKHEEKQSSIEDTGLFLGISIALMTVSVDCKQMKVGIGCEVYFALFSFSAQV